jgi:phenylalanyl-tRNA synthetase beta chain
MNVSYKWLRSFVDIDTDPKDFSHKMNMTGTEIKGFSDYSASIDKVVVAKILKIEKHPDADKLSVCTTDIGADEPIVIITGATNMKEGDLVPAALDGSTLPTGQKIKKGKLRGLESCGMFCSVEELGLTVNDYPGAIEDGLLILNSGVIGEPIEKTLGLDDIIFEADIVTNRPDCLSMIGVAREAAATFRKTVNIPTPVVKGSDGENGVVIKVYEPVIKGVAVVAQGADNIKVRSAITEAVCALFNISSAKVSVSKGQGD